MTNLASTVTLMFKIVSTTTLSLTYKVYIK